METLIEGRCKQTVYPQDSYGSFHGHQCHFKIWKDGYCKKHHPDTVKERRKMTDKRWEQKRENDPLTLAYKKIEELEKKIRELEGK